MAANITGHRSNQNDRGTQLPNTTRREKISIWTVQKEKKLHQQVGRSIVIKNISKWQQQQKY